MSSTCHDSISGWPAAKAVNAPPSYPPLCICRKCGGFAISKRASTEPTERSITIAPVAIKKALIVTMTNSAAFTALFLTRSL
ncbi:MAG: hypothetical protein L0H78_06890 [Humibacillus sp.]|nr:hypothetical protein [Humibacillus sp.]